ncbi:MAG: hypothetical protein LBT81_02305 [Helicobacteraceae bacterium]|jgi:hypothetical protein|nr:hypothetical protein [Helicobacteraceae bacterium]
MRKYEDLGRELRDKVEAALPLTPEQGAAIWALEDGEARVDYALDLILGEGLADETKEWEAALIYDKAQNTYPPEIVAALNKSEGLSRKQRKAIEKQVGVKLREILSAGEEKIALGCGLIFKAVAGDLPNTEFWHLAFAVKIIMRGVGLEEAEIKNLGRSIA